MLSTIIIPAVPATDDSSKVPERTAVETILNMSPENKEHYESEKEEIHFLLTGIGDEIYSTVDACKTAHDMWIAIERLQHGESLNIQDVKTNLFWEFGKFTSYDGESMESYYSKFYKMMNEIIRNNLTVATMQVNGNCRQSAEKGVTLKAEKADWLEDTDEEIDEQELEAHYSYMKKIQEVPITDSGLILSLWKSNVIPDSYDMYDNDIQTDQNIEECDDVRVALANLIANLKLDIDENKKDSKAFKESKCITGSRIERVQIYY
ncbi:hypothetical protein Tco_0260221 [Tanacetum coccineum]